MTNLKYIKWKDLIGNIKRNINVSLFEKASFQTQYPPKPQHNGLWIDKKLPISVSEAEFNFMKSFIEKNNLKKGYELATGTCISTIGLGLGFKNTGGKIISLDSYMEESSGRQPIKDSRISKETIPFERNKKIINLYNLEDTVYLEMGSSPGSCKEIFKKHNFEKLDFVFFDCPKSDSDYYRDLSSIKEYLDEKFVIFVHDTHGYRQSFIDITKQEIGIDPIFIYEFPTDEEGTKHFQYWPIAMITNIKNE